MYHLKIKYRRLFKINGLEENCSYVVESVGSYTYPFVCVGLSSVLSPKSLISIVKEQGRGRAAQAARDANPCLTVLFFYARKLPVGKDVGHRAW